MQIMVEFHGGPADGMIRAVEPEQFRGDDLWFGHPPATVDGPNSRSVYRMRGDPLQMSGAHAAVFCDFVETVTA